MHRKKYTDRIQREIQRERKMERHDFIKIEKPNNRMYEERKW